MSARITYPPEMLPSPANGEAADVLVEHPDTRKRTVIYSTDKRPSAIRKGEA